MNAGHQTSRGGVGQDKAREGAKQRLRSAGIKCLSNRLRLSAFSSHGFHLSLPPMPSMLVLGAKKDLPRAIGLERLMAPWADRFVHCGSTKYSLSIVSILTEVFLLIIQEKAIYVKYLVSSYHAIT